MSIDEQLTKILSDFQDNKHGYKKWDKALEDIKKVFKDCDE